MEILWILRRALVLRSYCCHAFEKVRAPEIFLVATLLVGYTALAGMAGNNKIVPGFDALQPYVAQSRCSSVTEFKKDFFEAINNFARSQYLSKPVYSESTESFLNKLQDSKCCIQINTNSNRGCYKTITRMLFANNYFKGFDRDSSLNHASPLEASPNTKFKVVNNESYLEKIKPKTNLPAFLADSVFLSKLAALAKDGVQDKKRVLDLQNFIKNIPEIKNKFYDFSAFYYIPEFNFGGGGDEKPKIALYFKSANPANADDREFYIQLISDNLSEVVVQNHESFYRDNQLSNNGKGVDLVVSNVAPFKNPCRFRHGSETRVLPDSLMMT